MKHHDKTAQAVTALNAASFSMREVLHNTICENMDTDPQKVQTRYIIKAGKLAQNIQTIETISRQLEVSGL